MTGLFSDVYYEVERDAEFVLRERGSKFYAYVYGVRSEAEVKEKLEVLKREYPDATHHCYAWVMGARGEAQRANDDGEPGNSAGRPILRAVISAGLTNVLVVVVRYFGGTMLGIPGLIDAYGGSAAGGGGGPPPGGGGGPPGSRLRRGIDSLPPRHSRLRPIQSTIPSISVPQQHHAPYFPRLGLRHVRLRLRRGQRNTPSGRDHRILR